MMRKAIPWLLANGIAVGFVIAAYFYGVNGAYNVTVAIVIVNFFASIGYLLSDIHSVLLLKGRRVPDWLDRTVDIFCLVVFAWYGSFVLFTIYLLSVTFQIYGWAKADELKADANLDPESEVQ